MCFQKLIAELLHLCGFVHLSYSPFCVSTKRWKIKLIIVCSGNNGHVQIISYIVYYGEVRILYLIFFWERIQEWLRGNSMYSLFEMRTWTLGPGSLWQDKAPSCRWWRGEWELTICIQMLSICLKIDKTLLSLQHSSIKTNVIRWKSFILMQLC